MFNNAINIEWQFMKSCSQFYTILLIFSVYIKNKGHKLHISNHYEFPLSLSLMFSPVTSLYWRNVLRLTFALTLILFNLLFMDWKCSQNSFMHGFKILINLIQNKNCYISIKLMIWVFAPTWIVTLHKDSLSFYSKLCISLESSCHQNLQNLHQVPSWNHHPRSNQCTHIFCQWLMPLKVNSKSNYSIIN